jgi:hypothetical protein
MLLGLFETSLSYGQVLLILAVLFGFYMAWNIGANDVAKAMGTSVGSESSSNDEQSCDGFHFDTIAPIPGKLSERCKTTCNRHGRRATYFPFKKGAP